MHPAGKHKKAFNVWSFPKAQYSD